jgi:predicted dehydrogenase/threonine dehydrogenase-like Zn-dependent dehydrogenase
MQAVTLNFRTGAIAVEEIPSPQPGQRAILVQNRASLISAGTEGYIIRMARKGPLGKALDRPDLVRQVLQRARLEGLWNTAKVVRNLIDSPLPMGYSSAGEVVTVGQSTDSFRPGDRVACAGLGMANHAEQVVVARTMACRLPENVSFEEGAFVTLGAIALHGVRLAKPELGETFVVLGLGLLGQLTAQILAAAGCRVLGFDIDPRKVELAKNLGLTAGGLAADESVLQIVDGHCGGYGADGVILTAHSRSRRPITLAARVSREKGRIIAVGLVNLKVPRRIFFEKELRLEVSRAYGAGAYDAEYEKKGYDYPIGFSRWTEGRNLAAFLDLVSQGKVLLGPLISHRFPVERAAEAYSLILGDRKELYLGVLLRYSEPSRVSSKIVLKTETAQAPGRDPLAFGVIGAGRFAQGILLPLLIKERGVRIRAVATGGGLTAKHVARRYGSEFCSSYYRDVLAREDIGSVLIATRHNLHGPIVAEAIQAQKNVFVEKPLAIREVELEEIAGLLRDYRGVLTVGFNRRFSPLARVFRQRLQERRQPLVISYRFLTPAIPRGHEQDWVHDPEVGGGRIVGEVCHMVDLASFLVGSEVKTVYAVSLAGEAGNLSNYDTVQVALRYADGSFAQLVYAANSDSSLPQERIELFWEGAYGLIDNFRRGLHSREGARKRFRTWSQQKGWKEEIHAFLEAVRQGAPPIAYASLIETTRVTFLIHRSLETGRIMDVPAS